MTLTPKIIKTEAEYEAVLARIEEIFEAVPGTPAGDELELLSTLVEFYEDKRFPIALPDPLTAIRFRMDQADLKQKDLVPYFGSQSKVSEVLSGRRPLSLAMIRALVRGLNIPAEVLLGQEGGEIEAEPPEWLGFKFPIAEMAKRGYFESFAGSVNEAKERSEELLRSFFKPLGQPVATLGCGLNRQSVRGQKEGNECALTAWRVRVVTRALREKLPPFRPESLSADYLKALVQLSYLEQGPLLAQEFLMKSGIALVFEPHLPRTHLDGAALRLPNGAPAIGLTVRFDRLDNFWFTLLHELAHVSLHLNEQTEAFFDDLSSEGLVKCEQEADAWAKDALIAPEVWQRAGLNNFSTPRQVCDFAEALRISPAIVAGRVRHDFRNHSVLQNLLGNRKVKALVFAA